MGFIDKLTLNDPASTRNAETRKVVLYTVDDATGKAVPLSAGQLGGGGGGAAPTVTATYPPQTLTVGASEASLTVPAGANAALVTVVSGSVRRSIGGVPGPASPGLGPNDCERLGGEELPAYRLVRDGETDALVYVEYHRLEGAGLPRVWPPQSLNVGTEVLSLTPPGSATHATVHVVTGSVYRSVGGMPAAGSPTLTALQSERISGAALAAYRLAQAGSVEAQVYVEYWSAP